MKPMFGFGKPIFSGSITDDDGNTADVEFDGSGHYEESRKVWRFRRKSGRVSTDQDCRDEHAGGVSAGFESHAIQINPHMV